MIIYYFEELCLQVRVGQIERTYIYEVLKTYVENNGVKSEVIKKFLTTNNLKYNLKFETKEIKVTTEEIIT